MITCTIYVFKHQHHEIGIYWCSLTTSEDIAYNFLKLSSVTLECLCQVVEARGIQNSISGWRFVLEVIFRFTLLPCLGHTENKQHPVHRYSSLLKNYDTKTLLKGSLTIRSIGKECGRSMAQMKRPMLLGV